MNHMNIFQNAQALLVSLVNTYSGDQLMHKFMDNFYQGRKYYAQIDSHQVDLRRENISDKNPYIFHPYRLII